MAKRNEDARSRAILFTLLALIGIGFVLPGIIRQESIDRKAATSGIVRKGTVLQITQLSRTGDPLIADVELVGDPHGRLQVEVGDIEGVAPGMGLDLEVTPDLRYARIAGTHDGGNALVSIGFLVGFILLFAGLAWFNWQTYRKSR